MHAYELSVCPYVQPADRSFVFKPIRLNVLSSCRSDVCLRIRPSICLTTYMHAYVEVYASVCSSVHLFYGSMNVLF